MLRFGLVSMSAVLAGGALLACGGDDSSTSTVPPLEAGAGDDSAIDGSASDSNTPDGNSPTDGNQTGDQENPTDAGREASTPYYGLVSASVTPVTGNNTYAAVALFGPSAEYILPGASCAGTKSGDCCYVAPPTPSDGGTDGGADAGPPAVTAGIITLSGANDAGTLATMSPSAGAYTAVSNPPTTSLTWNPGDALGVSATGDAVHPFTGTLQTGALLSGVNPSLGTPALINRGQNFTIAWTADTKAGETVVLSINASKGAAADGVITCVVPDSQAHIAVDSSLLGHFSAADTASITLLRDTNSSASDDNASIYLVGQVAESGTGTFL